MKNRKNKIAALTLAASMLLSATGCTSIRRNINDSNNITYSGKIQLEEIDDLYIIEFNDFNNEKQLYLTKKYNLLDGDSKFNLLGTETKILEQTKEKEIITNYGETKNIISFSQFIATYSELKEIYTADEIIEIFESVKSDYNELIDKDKVKKLELKK